MLTGLVAAAVLLTTPPRPASTSAAVEKGLKWLADKQTKAGYWEGINGYYKTTATAQAGLALMMEGSTPAYGRYAANIRRAVEWFESVAQSNGALVPADDPVERNRTVLSHAPALLFLASAYDLDEDAARRDRLRKVLEAAVGYAAEAQTRRGGWGFVPARDGNDFDDTTTTVAVFHALTAARQSGIGVPRKVTDRAAAYLLEATTPDGAVGFSLVNGRPRAGEGQPQSTAGAAGLMLTAERPPAAVAGWVAYSRRYGPYLPRLDQPAGTPADTNSVTLQQHLALARLANVLGESGHRRLAPQAADADLLRWSPLRERLFRHLRAAQAADGSWGDGLVGPASGTALALTILQLDNNYLPAYSR